MTQTLQTSLSIPKFLQSDDGAIISKVEGTHKPDGRQVDVENLSTIITKILLPDNPSGSGTGVTSGSPIVLEIPAQTINKLCCEGISIVHEEPAQIINKLSCKISCNCPGENAQETTIMLLEKLLSNYSWDAKLMIAVAAFAVNYGEFYMLTEFYSKNQVSKNLALLKQLQGVMEDNDFLEQFSEAIIELNKAIIVLIQSVLQFNTLPSEYVASNKPPFSTATTDITRAIYWTIYSVVTCASHIVGLIGLKNQRTVAVMTWELLELATKVSSIQTILQSHFCRIKQEIEAYNVLVNLFHSVQDITIIFQALFLIEGRKLSLVKGTTKQKFEIEVLRDANVLLLISGLDAWEIEIKALDKLFEQLQRKHNIQYQLVWIPIVEGQFNEQKFLSLQSLMPWYTVKHPSLVKPEVIRYIKEVWKFSKSAILVPVDQKGRAESVYTLDLLWLKGYLPGLLRSSLEKEISLWEEKQLTLDILIHDLYLVDSTKPAPIVCLYGGEDMKWIEEFIAAITRVKEFTELNIELVYVSKSNTIDQANKAIFDFIVTNKIGVYWKAEETKSWRFWTRLESIFSSGLKSGKNAKEDNIMKDVITLLNFNGSCKGWAILGQLGCHQKLAKATGEVILHVLLKINTWWKLGTSSDSFLATLNNQIEQQLDIQAQHFCYKTHHCNHIVLPATILEVQDEMMTCATCGRRMHKYLTYQCCV
ncbi:hypothetical protein JCGZ_15095 [Jatropha curcas]|uniref:Sieve element occlusion N-terminal domain-containing protein n=2 Tax=Jatropha curcas TaxID=180498 RepID=A0A067LKM7_JATCU|nr:hypothetical protein JCGZ_15095 [Jatropha curcas]